MLPKIDGVVSTPARRRVARRGKRRFARFWRTPIADGTYSAIPTWVSRDRWLEAVRVAAEDAYYSARAAGVLAVARVLAGHADQITGREVRVSVDQVAYYAGVGERTVQRRIADLSALGFVVTVDEGRYLTTTERDEARLATGRRVISVASTRALTLPRRYSAVTPPTASAVGASRTYVDGTKTRAARRPKLSNRASFEPRSLGVQRLAGRLVADLPWLAQHRHVGALCDALVTAGVDPDVWTHLDVIDAVDGLHAAQRRTCLGRDARDPIAWLVWALRSAMVVGYRTRSERARDAAVRREAIAAARRAAREQERTRIAPADSPAAQVALGIARRASSTVAAVRRSRAEWVPA